MKYISLAFLFTSLFISTTAFSAGTFPLKEVKFELKTTDVVEKTEEALGNPEPILIEYQPVDAVITNKEVHGNVIEFDATKNILGIKKTAHVYGILTITRNDSLCPKSTMGFDLLMDLMNSSDLVSKNIEKLTATLCFDKKDSKVLMGHSKGLMYKSDDYNRIEGGIIRTFIDNQVEPIISALKRVVEKQ